MGLDISFAIHQCTCYCNNPTALYELAVKCIGQYLFASRDKGIKLHPQQKFKLDMYLDSEFAGSWHHDYSELHKCIPFLYWLHHNVLWLPHTWASKLQIDIALSSTDSEYIALSIF
jgi:hypothetical protein